MGNPRAEAAARAGGRDGRVLEPSPPAVREPPFLADDPLDGGEVLPVERSGATTWEELCGPPGTGDGDLRAWCEDRWLVPRRPIALPAAFAETRRSLHAVAEHVLAPCRHAATGKIGLRFTYHGFGTPFFGAGSGRQARVEDGDLVDDDGTPGNGRRTAVTTLREAAAFFGIEAGAPPGVYTPTTACDPDAHLSVDTAAARALGDWYGLCARLLEQVRAESPPADAPSRVQLWPEHFDLALDAGPEGRRANFGGSPGDDVHPEPYLYVGPWDTGAVGPHVYWNEPFGASLSFMEILCGADPLEFLRQGRELLR
ncbi:MAG TPA: hypothetical protein VHM89_01500 [Acidimicrobiales bacterium]|nr:hypothetical protein [Acidimicrobiales bacterium]